MKWVPASTQLRRAASIHRHRNGARWLRRSRACLLHAAPDAHAVGDGEEIVGAVVLVQARPLLLEQRGVIGREQRHHLEERAERS